MNNNKFNKYPFLFLLILHSSILLYSFYKNRNKKRMFILLLTNIGFAYIFEYFVLNLFQAYKYKPNIIKVPYLDNILGAIMSQAIYIPFTATFLTSLKLGWKWRAFFSFYFVLVEKTFLKLGIYSTNWWRTAYTGTAIPIYFYLSDAWDHLLKIRSQFAMFLSLYLSIAVFGINFLYGFVLIRNFRFGKGLNHSWVEHFKIAPLYSLGLSFISATFVRKNGWASKLAIVLIASIMDLFLQQIKLVKTNIKTIIENLFIHTGMVFISLGLKKLIYKENANT